MMILVIAVLAFIVAVVFLIVYLVQMHRTKNRYLGKDAVNTIARNAAEKARQKDKILTCDYCGAKIDTTVHTVCPQCGAAYGKDKEWLNRHKVDPAAMDRHIQKGLAKNKAAVTELNASRMKRVVILLICIASAVVFLVTIAIFASSVRTARLNSSEKIPDDYVKTDYQFVDPVLCDNENIKLELGNIYCRTDHFLDEDRYDYKIEVLISNKTGKEGTVDIDLAAANGKCTYTSLLYEKVGGKGDVTRLLDLRNYNFGDEAIKNLAFAEIRFMDRQYNELFRQSSITNVETTSTYVPEEIKVKGDILFEKNGIVVSCFRGGKDNEQNFIQFTNTGTYNYKMRTYASIVNGDVDRLWIDYYIPAGCQALTDLNYQIYLPDNEVLESAQIQLEFKCEEHPEQNFVTDYLTLPVGDGTLF